MDLEILKIASYTKNNKILKNHTHHAKNKNPICGDEMIISIIVKNDKIVDFGYQCKSCIYCQASISLLSKNSLNKKISYIKSLLKIAINFYENDNIFVPKKFSVFKKILNKKNISRKECLLLPFKTLTKVLEK